MPGLHGLTKQYGRRTVVDQVDLHIPSEGVTGLVGPNGAGKTTIMSMLLGLVRPSDGGGTVLGHDLADTAAYLHRVGALIEGPAFHPGMSGHEGLVHLAILGGHDRSRIPEVLDLVGLAGREHDPYRSYSLGMKQRLGISAALLGDPDLVILDEPTNGVDPAGMRDIRAMVRRIAGEGRSVLVSSHLLSELEAVCDHLVVINQGGLQYAGDLASLATAGGATLSLRTRHTADLSVLAELLRCGGLAPEVIDDAVRVAVDGLPAADLAQDGGGILSVVSGAAFASVLLLAVFVGLSAGTISRGTSRAALLHQPRRLSLAAGTFAAQVLFIAVVALVLRRRDVTA